ncbi:MAG: hypothetical protein KF893_23005 [Caldilineaceae bacterium]|nr:hypothetical protein [Caldilineaceae bacterium]
MPRHTTYMLVAVLLILAVAPWIVSSCAAEPLIPEELRLERVYFEATVDAGQQARMQEERDAPSSFGIVPLGTISPEDAPTPTPVQIVITPTPEPIEEQEDEAEADLLEDESELAEAANSTTSSTVLKVETSVAAETPVPTARIIIIRSEAAQPTALPAVTESDTLTTTEEITTVASIALPLNMVAVEDLITEQMLAMQVQQDVADTALSNLTITFTPEGVQAMGSVVLLGGIRQPLVAIGTFVVENDSLVTKVSSIRLGRLDVTERYRGQLEAGVNSSLYRLLPQRYVQSFELSHGELLVHSQVRQ